MVHILDGNSDIGVHVFSNFSHLFKSITVTYLNYFIYMCLSCSKLPSNISIMGKTVYMLDVLPSEQHIFSLL